MTAVTGVNFPHDRRRQRYDGDVPEMGRPRLGTGALTTNDWIGVTMASSKRTRLDPPLGKMDPVLAVLS